MNISKTLAVASREYWAAVRSKSFLIGLILVPIWMCGGLVAAKFSQGNKDTSTYQVAIVDRTPGESLYPAIAAAVAHHNRYEIADSNGKPTGPRFVLEPVIPADPADPAAVAAQRLNLSQRVRSGELLAFVEIGKNVLSGGGSPFSDDNIIRYSSNRLTFYQFINLLYGTIPTAVYHHRFAATGLSREKLDQMLQSPDVIQSGLVEQHGGQVAFESQTKRAAPLIVSVVMVMIMFMVAMLGTSPMVGNVIEEKQLRIAEVLLGGIRPFDLMMGKLIGGCGVALTLNAIFCIGAYALAWRFGVAGYITLESFGWFVFFSVVTTFLYGSLFAATGSACTNIKEAQSFMAPVMLLIGVPLFFLGPMITNPTSNLTVGLSMFPLSAPVAMMLRIAMPPGVPTWQPLIAAAGVLLATIFCVWAAGRIFRVGILMQGKGANYSTVVRWMFSG